MYLKKLRSFALGQSTLGSKDLFWWNFNSKRIFNDKIFLNKVFSTIFFLWLKSFFLIFCLFLFNFVLFYFFFFYTDFFVCFLNTKQNNFKHPSGLTTMWFKTNVSNFRKAICLTCFCVTFLTHIKSPQSTDYYSIKRSMFYYCFNYVFYLSVSSFLLDESFITFIAHHKEMVVTKTINKRKWIVKVFHTSQSSSHTSTSIITLSTLFDFHVPAISFLSLKLLGIYYGSWWCFTLY